MFVKILKKNRWGSPSKEVKVQNDFIKVNDTKHITKFFLKESA